MILSFHPFSIFSFLYRLATSSSWRTCRGSCRRSCFYFQAFHRPHQIRRWRRRRRRRRRRKSGNDLRRRNRRSIRSSFTVTVQTTTSFNPTKLKCPKTFSNNLYELLPTSIFGKHFRWLSKFTPSGTCLLVSIVVGVKFCCCAMLRSKSLATVAHVKLEDNRTLLTFTFSVNIIMTLVPC